MESKWEPNPDYLQTLIAMGISQNVATEALFCTGNSSLDDAVNYVFNYQETEQRNAASRLEKASGGLEIGNSEDESAEEEDIKCYKMIFVVNTALKMGVGKIAAQVGHACLGLYREILEQNKEDDLRKRKIVLKGNDEAHLQELYEKAKANSIPCHIVRDAGHTQVAPNSVTVLSLFGVEDDPIKYMQTVGSLMGIYRAFNEKTSESLCWKFKPCRSETKKVRNSA
ncbi:hypothetical protein NQ317_003111 [Molorchus minor]|uniref:peptidyl-tRNA hydrolase n=1 Tax=Molorchus minor TaxID=1323400 RepID=A0ABQ9JGY1_9CUCU|nr:hypothetical protein NQ317_003111 [Molorchus minor]